MTSTWTSGRPPKVLGPSRATFVQPSGEGTARTLLVYNLANMHTCTRIETHHSSTDPSPANPSWDAPMKNNFVQLVMRGVTLGLAEEGWFGCRQLLKLA
jgi:hypothetical protein